MPKKPKPPVDLAPKMAPVDRFSEDLGRDAVLEMLVTAEKGSKFESLYTEIQRYGSHKVSLATLCMRLGISWASLIEFHRNYNVQRGLLRAANHAPEIIEDVAGDSKSKNQGCKRCDGAGKLPDPTLSADGDVHLTKPCPDCDGRGVVRVPGDQGSRTLLFEMLGLTGKAKNGPMFQLNQQFNGSGVESIANIAGGVQKLIGGRE